MNPIGSAHIRRVRQELALNGITRHGLARAESCYVPDIIDPDEHIKAAILGRRAGGAAMLIATDERLIFLDRMPLIAISDEMSFKAVSTVKHYSIGPFATVELHSKEGEYVLNRVDKRAAAAFVRFIEKEIFDAIKRYTERLVLGAEAAGTLEN